MIRTISININLDSKVTIQQSYFCISQWWTFERFWRRDMYWHDSDWPCCYKSYLSEHYYTAEVANWISKFTNILCGVQQGSIWRPLLFLICVNDMNQAVKCDLYLYADDSCFIFQHKKVTETKKKVNQRLQQYLWLVCRQWTKYTFWGIKKKSILFSSRHNSKLVGELQWWS